VASWMDRDGVQIDSPAERMYDPYQDITDRDVVDKICLDYVTRGGTPKYLAKYLKVSVRTIERNVARAKLIAPSRNPYADPECAILFPINEFTPTSECVHPDPIPHGKNEYCPTCHKTGIESHPAFRHRPGDTESPRIQPPRDESLHGGTDSPKKPPRKPKSKLFRKMKRAQSA
jgi:hypothetical protein